MAAGAGLGPQSVATGNSFAALFPAPALGARPPNCCQAVGNPLFMGLSKLSKWPRPVADS